METRTVTQSLTDELAAALRQIAYAEPSTNVGRSIGPLYFSGMNKQWQISADIAFKALARYDAERSPRLEGSFGVTPRSNILSENEPMQMTKPKASLSESLKNLERLLEEGAVAKGRVVRLEAALRLLVIHDTVVDMREGLDGCVELQHARDVLGECGSVWYGD
jgi:hypothetical protein